LRNGKHRMGETFLWNGHPTVGHLRQERLHPDRIDEFEFGEPAGEKVWLARRQSLDELNWRQGRADPFGEIDAAATFGMCEIIGHAVFIEKQFPPAVLHFAAE